jgi:PD-(D/E)XK nuclease superfamily
MLPTIEQIQTAFVKILRRQLDYSPHVYHCSEMGFCLEKIVLSRRTGTFAEMNGKMVKGSLFHSLLPQMIKSIPDIAKSKKSHIRYEKKVRFDDPRGFIVEGHIDVDLPAESSILEFKTTDQDKAWNNEDPVLTAYTGQANAYANIINREKCWLFILCTDFDNLEDPLENPDCTRVVSRITFNADPDDFKRWLDRVWFVDQAITNGRDLQGPEVSWECKYCSFYRICPYHKDNCEAVMAYIPCKKNEIPENLMAEFDILVAKKIIFYDWQQKLYVRSG